MRIRAKGKGPWHGMSMRGKGKGRWHAGRATTPSHLHLD